VAHRDITRRILSETNPDQLVDLLRDKASGSSAYSRERPRNCFKRLHLSLDEERHGTARVGSLDSSIQRSLKCVDRCSTLRVGWMSQSAKHGILAYVYLCERKL